MLEVAQQAVDAARRAGADYADARFVSTESETLTVRNQEMETLNRGLSQGIGIRVLTGGYWGFAATARTTPEDIERTAGLAVSIARAASRPERTQAETPAPSKPAPALPAFRMEVAAAKMRAAL